MNDKYKITVRDIGDYSNPGDWGVLSPRVKEFYLESTPATDEEVTRVFADLWRILLENDPPTGDDIL